MATSIATRVSFAIFFEKVGAGGAAILRKLAGAFSSISNSIGMGLLDLDQIKQLVCHSYATQPEFYNPENYDHQWEEEIIAPLQERTTGKRLIVAFCGKGREAAIFARHGYSVTAIDREMFMIEDARRIAEERGFEATFLQADFDSYHAGETFDVVYTSTWMFTTYPTRASRRGFLDKCKELCCPGGLIVISYRRRSDRFLDKAMSIAAQGVSIVTFNRHRPTRGDRLERGLFWHYFTEEEIEAELSLAEMKTAFFQPSSDGMLEWRFLRTADATVV